MQKEILDALNRHAEQTRVFDGSVRQTIGVMQTTRIAERFGVSSRIIEITALDNGIVPNRYLRNLNTYSPAQQLRLLRSQVTVVGLGGLGGTVVEILARAGVGSLVLVDGDHFEDHNLNRQLLSNQSDLGVSKVKAAAQRVHSVNSAVELKTCATDLDEHNAADLIGTSQAVVDCLDNIATRFILEKAARKADVPFVSAAVAGLSGHITTIFPQDPGLEQIYGPQDAVRNNKGIEVEMGCLPQAVVMIASLECEELSKVLLGLHEHLLRGRLLMLDLSQNIFEIIHLS